jgi:hypothetical protein
VAEFSPQQILAKIASIYIAPAEFLQSVFQEEASVANKLTPEADVRQGISETLKSWMMVILTLGFVVLYGFGLSGKLGDSSMVSRLEPIIFVIVGYYFGRLPAQQTENTLKAEIGRQTQKADAAQHAKEQALQSREAFEERLKNVNAALLSVPDLDVRSLGRTESSDGNAVKHSIAAARNILNS